MKQLQITILLAMLLSMAGTKAFAQYDDYYEENYYPDITVPNEDGVIIYYDFINNGMELSVSCKESTAYQWYSWEFNWWFNGSEYYSDYTGNIIIPETVTYNGMTYPVTRIGGCAFYNCSGLTNVTIPNSVTSIGNCAFESCSGLTSVSIPNSVTSIGNRAFSGCFSLTSVSIGNSLNNIGGEAFLNCSNLTRVDITDLDAWCKIVFHKYYSFHFEDSYYDSGYEVFDGNLQVFSWSSNPLSYAHHLYLNGEEVKEIDIPSSITTISELAFAGCSSLTRVNIPSSVTAIGVDAFYGCFGLTKVNITDLAAWCKVNFETDYNSDYYDEEQHELYSNTFFSTGSNPLAYAHHLYINGEEMKDLVIPSSVTSLGKIAFFGCSSLKSVVIPNSVTTISNSTFSCCSGLTNVEIPNSVTSIGDSAFGGCSGLTSVTIPNSVITIGNSAFCNCYNLTSVTIPNSVTSIGNRAFYDCSSLTSVSIGNSLNNIGGEAFFDCFGLSRVDITDIEAWCRIVFSDSSSNPLSYAHHLYKNGEEIKDLVFPNSITGICNYAFSGCSGLTSITIPNSVTSVGNHAFGGCSGLSSLTFYCQNVRKWFQGMSNLQKVIIGNGVTTVDNFAFTGCTGLTNVEIHCCPSFGSNVFPNNIKEVIFDCEIVTPLFKGFSSIENVAMTESVTSIEDNAFKGCKNLATLEIGKSVENIGMRAFANIDKLNDVTCYAEEVPTTDRTAFENSYTDYATLHVPAVALNDYITTAPWSGFKTVLPLTEAVYTLTYLVDGNIYKQYEMAYGATITPEPEPVKEGYTFSGWSEIPETMPAHDVTVSGYFTLSDTSWPETVTIKMTVPNGDRTAIGYSSAYGLDFTNVSEVKAWVVTGFTDQAEVLLSRVKIVPPRTGLYLTSDVAGVEVTVPTTEQDIWYANLLLPAVEEETITPTEMKDGEEYTNFVVGKLYSGEMGFVRVTATRTLGPNKSRLLVPSRYYSIPGDSRGGLRVDFIDEQTTDVNGAMRLNDKGKMMNDDEVYDLQGRRVTNSQLKSGLYIRGGKKVIIK